MLSANFLGRGGLYSLPLFLWGGEVGEVDLGAGLSPCIFGV